MKVSHELPPSLFRYSYKWNDYDYCLPHLLDKIPEYKEYFLKAKADNRFIIMDNGLFEGVKHTTEDLIAKINLIEPDIFVVPDDWNNPLTTYQNAKYWINTLKIQLPTKTNLMVVMQGKDMLDLKQLYIGCIDLGYTYFSFNHSSKAYQGLFNHPNHLINSMFGRVYIINKLREEGFIQDNHYIHLLGCSLPQEMLYYDSSLPFIKSVDSSNPIIYGALGKLYYPWGVLDKPKEKIESFFDLDLEGKIDDIIFNVQNFKGFLEQKMTT